VVTTEGRLLGGRVIHIQPESGFRSGIEPVLLAASVPAQSGEHVLEAGTGTGAALLCLHARVPSLRSVGVERDADVADLARANARANGFADMAVVTGPIESVTLARDFDHALANPPYHPATGTMSPMSVREAAKRGSSSLLQIWVGRLAACLRHRGSLTLVMPSGMVPDGLIAMAAAHCPCTTLYPLWPKAGRAAKLVLLRGIRDSKAPMALSPGLVLHRPDGLFTPETESLLRDGLALDV
jgi:tRNA1(Val) A37 N6-methylase TrmN6